MLTKSADEASCAIFYTITNLQPQWNLAPMGKQLVYGALDELKSTLPSLHTFSTLSPVPGFAQWLKEEFKSVNNSSSQSSLVDSSKFSLQELLSLMYFCLL